ncbi:MAG TPA: hypothetical protein VFG35_08085 [Actinoplanes sp.]|nr:hypothetical protein [Actinoplanes sp.]
MVKGNGNNVVRPEDMIPDNADVLVVSDDVQVRKGTVAAFIATAQNLAKLEPGTSEYDEVVAQLRALTPALRAVGLFEIFEVRSPDLRALIADA